MTRLENVIEEVKTAHTGAYRPWIFDCVWDYEYAIFELVRLYKSFDWENDELVLVGW